VGYPPHTRDVAICRSEYLAQLRLRDYAEPSVPFEGGWGEPRFTYRVVETDEGFVVRGYNTSALEELGRDA
jgi:hypothetical protein